MKTMSNGLFAVVLMVVLASADSRHFTTYDLGTMFLSSPKTPKHTLFPTSRRLKEGDIYVQYNAKGYTDTSSKPAFCGECPKFPLSEVYYATALCVGYGPHLKVLLTQYMNSFLIRVNKDFAAGMDYLKINGSPVNKVTMKVLDATPSDKGRLSAKAGSDAVGGLSSNPPNPDDRDQTHFAFLLKQIEAIGKSVKNSQNSINSLAAKKKFKTEATTKEVNEMLNKFFNDGVYGKIAKVTDWKSGGFMTDKDSKDVTTDMFSEGTMGAEMWAYMVSALGYYQQLLNSSGKQSNLNEMIRLKLKDKECEEYVQLFEVSLESENGAKASYYLGLKVKGGLAGAGKLTFPITTTLYMPKEGFVAVGKNVFPAADKVLSVLKKELAASKTGVWTSLTKESALAVELNVNGYFDRPGRKENTVACIHALMAVRQSFLVLSEFGFGGIEFANDCQPRTKKIVDNPPGGGQDEEEPPVQKKKEEPPVDDKKKPPVDDKKKPPVDDKKEPPVDNKPGSTTTKIVKRTEHTISKTNTMSTEIEITFTGDSREKPKVIKIPYWPPEAGDKPLDCQLLLSMILNPEYHTTYPDLQRIDSFAKFLGTQFGIGLECRDEPECPDTDSPKESKRQMLSLILRSKVILGMSLIYFEGPPSNGPETVKQRNIRTCSEITLKITNTGSGKFNCFTVDFNEPPQDLDPDSIHNFLGRQRSKAVQFLARGFLDTMELIGIYFFTSIQVPTVKQLFYADFEAVSKVTPEPFIKAMGADEEKPDPVVDHFLKVLAVNPAERSAYTQTKNQYLFILQENAALRDKESFVGYINHEHPLFKETGVKPNVRVEVEVMEVANSQILVTLRMGASTLQLTIPQYWDFDVLFGSEQKWEVVNLAPFKKADLVRVYPIALLRSLVRQQSVNPVLLSLFLAMKTQYLVHKFGQAILGWLLDNVRLLDLQSDDLAPIFEVYKETAIVKEEKAKEKVEVETVVVPEVSKVQIELRTLLRQQTISFTDAYLMLLYALTYEGYIDAGSYRFLKERAADVKAMDAEKARELLSRLSSLEWENTDNPDDALEDNKWFLTAVNFGQKPQTGGLDNDVYDGTGTGTAQKLTEKDVWDHVKLTTSFLTSVAEYQPIRYLRGQFRPVNQTLLADRSGLFGAISQANTFFNLEVFDYSMEYWNVVHVKLSNRYFDGEYALFTSDAATFYSEVLRMVRDFSVKTMLRQKLKLAGNQAYIIDNSKMDKLVAKQLKQSGYRKVCYEKGEESAALDQKIKEAKGAYFGKQKEWVFYDDGALPEGEFPKEIPECPKDRSKWISYSYLVLMKTADASAYENGPAPKSTPFMWILQFWINANSKGLECGSMLYEMLVRARYDYRYSDVVHEFVRKAMSRLKERTVVYKGIVAEARKPGSVKQVEKPVVVNKDKDKVDEVVKEDKDDDILEEGEENIGEGLNEGNVPKLNKPTMLNKKPSMLLEKNKEEDKELNEVVENKDVNQVDTQLNSGDKKTVKDGEENTGDRRKLLGRPTIRRLLRQSRLKRRSITLASALHDRAF